MLSFPPSFTCAALKVRVLFSVLAAIVVLSSGYHRRGSVQAQLLHQEVGECTRKTCKGDTAGHMRSRTSRGRRCA